MMSITDLPYFENVSEDETILGSSGAVLGVGAVAVATGDDTFTSATAITDVKKIGNGKVTKGTGYGEALAIGEDPYADVGYLALGFDKVIVKTKSKQGEDYDYVQVKIKAIDTPGK
jgi:hypothetical protein